jgi:type I restriction enzyme S subunit
MGHVKDLKTGIKYKNTPIGKIPVDWELVRLEDICSISSGGASNYSKDVNEKTYPVYGSNGILGSYDEFNFSDGLVIGRVGASGSIHMISSPVWASDNTLLLSITDRFAQKLFIYYYLQKCNLPGLATKTAQPLLTQQILKSVLIAKPNIYEQKKIAEILTIVDAAIEKTAQVIETTKEAKKGLMQKLLTRGIGHKKFKKTEIGEIPVEWEVRRLGNLCNGQPEYGANVSSIDKDKSLPRYVRITDITEDGKLLEATWQSIKREFAEPYILGEGDFLFARSGATVGKTYLYRDKDGECSFAGYMIRFKPNPKQLLPEFLFQYTHSNFYYNWVKGILRAGAQPNINAQEYFNMHLPKPPINEQKQIAEILSSIDNEIEKESDHKEQLELLKKGLMQVLLTGKIRVS